MLVPNYLLKYKTETLPFVLRCSFIVVWISWFMSKQGMHSQIHRHTQTNSQNTKFKGKTKMKTATMVFNIQWTFTLSASLPQPFTVYYSPCLWLFFFRFHFVWSHSKHFSFQFIYTINKRWKKKLNENKPERMATNGWAASEWAERCLDCRSANSV